MTDTVFIYAIGGGDLQMREVCGELQVKNVRRSIGQPSISFHLLEVESVQNRFGIKGLVGELVDRLRRIGGRDLELNLFI